jgi:4-hydroxybenzoate polyprenyltransferase
VTQQLTPPPAPCESLARFVRLFSMGATVVYVLVGIATTALPPAPGLIGAGLVVGVAFHVFADVGNDVVDLPIDRGDPRRARGPLVRGAISPPAALAVALAQLPVMFATLHLGGAAPTATYALMGALVCLTAYDLVGKALPVPFVADHVQGLGWALLVVTGAELAGGSTVGTLLAAVFVSVYVAMVNGVHGAVRDVANDRASGASTTALRLGVRRTSAGGLVLPPAVVGYTVGVAIVLAGLLTGVVWWGLRVGTGWAPWATAGIAVVLHLASIVTLTRTWAARTRLRAVMALGTWHLFLVPASLVAASLWSLGWLPALVTVAAFVLPPVAFGWVTRGLAFDLPGQAESGAVARAAVRVRVAALWELARPGVPAAAATLAAIGAVLADAAGWPAVLLVALAGAAIVAAANLQNDRCDERADAVNRPDRPLPSGRITGNEVDRAVLGFAVIGVAALAPLGAGATAAGAALLAIATGAPLFVRRLPVAGELTTALLFAVTVPFGGAVAGERLRVVHAIAAGLILLFVLAREMLMGVRDIPGDAVAGYRTVAVAAGPDVAVTAFRVSMVGFAVAVVVPCLVPPSVGALAVVLVLVVAPVSGALWALRGQWSAASIDTALHRTGVVFGTGLVPLLLLGPTT